VRDDDVVIMAEQGFGCMGWSAFYKTCSDDAAVAVFEAAVAKGVVLFNTGFVCCVTLTLRCRGLHRDGEG